MSVPRDLLRLNVGFIVHQSIGFTRDFPIEAPEFKIAPDLDLRDIQGTVRVSRAPQGLLVQVKLQATTWVECGRCLSEFSQPLSVDFTELFAFSRNSVTESGLVMPETGKLNLEPLVRDEMLLSIPINPICEPDCLGLCPVCGENLNLTTCNHEEEQVDLRLIALKSLLENGNETTRH